MISRTSFIKDLSKDPSNDPSNDLSNDLSKDLSNDLFSIQIMESPRFGIKSVLKNLVIELQQNGVK